MRVRLGLLVLGAVAASAPTAPALAAGEAPAPVVKILAVEEPTFVAGPRGLSLALPGANVGSGAVVARDCTVVTSAHVLEGHTVFAVRFTDEPRLFPAGEGWAYHGSNYLVLRLLEEQLRGKRAGGRVGAEEADDGHRHQRRLQPDVARIHVHAEAHRLATHHRWSHIAQ